MGFVYEIFLSYSQILLHADILRHGDNGFTSSPKEGVLRMFIALKNEQPRPGLNVRTLGPMTSTLVTTPLRRLKDAETIMQRFENVASSHTSKELAAVF
jgi:hypothetical protein